MKGLSYEGWQHHKAGRSEVAVRVLDLCAQLDPKNREVISMRTFILRGGDGPNAARLQGLRDLQREHPDDPFVLRQLDYVASVVDRDFKGIDALWTDYLTRHPDDGRALLERAGTRHRLGRTDDARADLLRSCELGLSEACALLRR